MEGVPNLMDVLDSRKAMTQVVATSTMTNDKVTHAEALHVQTVALLQVMLNNQQLRAMGLPEVPIPSTLLPITQASVIVLTTQFSSITISDSRLLSKQVDRAHFGGRGDRQENRSANQTDKTDEAVAR